MGRAPLRARAIYGRRRNLKNGRDRFDGRMKMTIKKGWSGRRLLVCVPVHRNEPLDRCRPVSPLDRGIADGRFN